MEGADVTLYAHWTAVGYAVTLHLNGGGLLGDTAGWTVSGDTAIKQFQIDTPDFTLPEAVRTDNHSFIGWTEADGYRPTSLAQGMKEIAADIAAENAAPDKTEDVTITLKTQTVPDLSETPDGNLSEQERTAKREQTQIKTEMETLGVYHAAEQLKSIWRKRFQAASARNA